MDRLRKVRPATWSASVQTSWKEDDDVEEPDYRPMGRLEIT